MDGGEVGVVAVTDVAGVGPGLGGVVTKQVAVRPVQGPSRVTVAGCCK